MKHKVLADDNILLLILNPQPPGLCPGQLPPETGSPKRQNEVQNECKLNKYVYMAVLPGAFEQELFPSYYTFEKPYVRDAPGGFGYA